MAVRSITSAKVTAKITATINNIMDDNQTASGPVSIGGDLKLDDGVSLNEVSRGWQWIHTAANPKTISSGGTLVIDVFDFGILDMGAGVGDDIVGQDLELLEIVAIMIKNANADGVAGRLEIEPDPVNGWNPIGSHTVATGGALRAQGVLLKLQPDTTGFAVTDASSHRILLTANGADVDVEMALLARHDVEESSSSSSSISSSSKSSSISSSFSSSSSPSSVSSPSSASSSSSSISSSLSSIRSSSSSSPSSSSLSSLRSSSSSRSSSSASSVSSMSSSSMSSVSSSSSLSSSSASSQS